MSSSFAQVRWLSLAIACAALLGCPPAPEVPDGGTDPCSDPTNPDFCSADVCPDNAATDLCKDPCDDPGSDFYCAPACNNCDKAQCAGVAGCPGDNPCETDPPDLDACCAQYPNNPLCIQPPDPTESCLECHAAGGKFGDPNAIKDPHPWKALKCTDCHGGDPQGNGKAGSHVPFPPGLSDQEIINDTNAGQFKGEFNRRTLAGIDYLSEYKEYTVNGKTYTGLDWLHWINPGDLRVVNAGMGCGKAGCHADKAAAVGRNVIATEIGLLSTARFFIGLPNNHADRKDLDYDTVADVGPRQLTNPDYTTADRKPGEVDSLDDFPLYAGRNFYPDGNYQEYTADIVNNSRYVGDPNQGGNPEYDGKIIDGLAAHLVNTAFDQQCGDCHLWQAGNNNRYADFRGSGCTACHFEYAFDGRYRGKDPNVNRLEPANPDAIAPGERSHPRDHQIRNVAKTLPNGAFVAGISDRNCVGCHQGSNRTVLQYWGYRIDPNQYLVNNLPNPYTPVNFQTGAVPDPASNAPPLRDPNINNNTFNGLNIDTQIISFEDYDGDGLDDTPPDIHHQRGMYCIDCHGSNEMHGDGTIRSRQDQMVAIQCENCHGTVDGYAPVDAQGYALDSWGRRITNVTKDANGDYWLRSRVTGELHYVPQVPDVVYDTGKVNPKRQTVIYNQLASFAMGRYDGDARTGQGPVQNNYQVRNGFSHSGKPGQGYNKGGLACATCHAGWQNNCIGCHLDLTFDGNQADQDFSPIWGEQVYTEIAATFRYVNPVESFLGINSRGKIAWFQPQTKMFFSWTDYQGNTSNKLVYSNRQGYGANTFDVIRGNNQALGFNQMAPHTIQPELRVFANKDPNTGLQWDGLGAVKDCFSCHLTNDGTFNTANDANAVARLRLKLGLDDNGLYAFDANGEPVAETGNAAAYQLGIVLDENTGKSFASNTHIRLDDKSENLRTDQPHMAGPLTVDLINRQLNVLILDTVYAK